MLSLRIFVYNKIRMGKEEKGLAPHLPTIPSFFHPEQPSNQSFFQQQRAKISLRSVNRAAECRSAGWTIEGAEN